MVDRPFFHFFPDNVSRERTAEIIDASKGGDPEIREGNWRLTSQANKHMINLWKGKTIFTFCSSQDHRRIPLLHSL